MSALISGRAKSDHQPLIEGEAHGCAILRDEPHDRRSKEAKGWRQQHHTQGRFQAYPDARHSRLWLRSSDTSWWLRPLGAADGEPHTVALVLECWRYASQYPAVIVLPFSRTRSFSIARSDN